MGLFKPAWMSANKEKALKAISKIPSCSDIWIDIANKAPCLEIRVKAVSFGRFDNNTLLNIMKNHTDVEVRAQAARKIVDQTDDPFAFDSAYDYLTTNNIFIEKRVREKSYMMADSRIRDEIAQITDRRALADIAKSTDANRVKREAAVAGITDPSVLIEIATDTSIEEYVRTQAIEHLNNQAALFDIAANGDSQNVRVAAFHRLTDKDMTAKALKNHEHEWKSVSVPYSQLAFSGRQPYKCLICGAEKHEVAE